MLISCVCVCVYIADLRPTIAALRAEQDYLLTAMYLKHDATAETAELLSSAYLLSQPAKCQELGKIFV